MSNNKTRGLAFRCTDEQAYKILEAAGLEGLDYSTFVRNAAVSFAEHTLKKHKKEQELDKSLVNNFNKALEENKNISKENKMPKIIKKLNNGVKEE